LNRSGTLLTRPGSEAVLSHRDRRAGHGKGLEKLAWFGAVKNPVDGVTLFVKFRARLTDLEQPLTRQEQDRISWARVFVLKIRGESWLIPQQSEPPGYSTTPM
jgi:hypothetical protein